MAKFPYKRSAATAQRLINKFGSDCKLYRMGTDDPSDYNTAPNDKTEYNIKAVALPASTGKIDGFDLHFDEGFTVQNVRFGYIAVQMSKVSGTGAAAIMPMPQDVIRMFDGKEMTLIGTRELNPAGQAVYYSFAARV